ncbi:MAG: B12-binding domain-containing radical SAM protein [Proteobacteria bacterium]|nr:B12-binding domain-containing radical SAM protein [Pseudomonadota bacterium]
MKRPVHILLVYPEIPKNTYWSYNFALDFINKKSSMPPLGLVTVASYFPENFKFRLLDMNIEPLEDEAVKWADMVFVSAMIVQKPSLANVIETCKRLDTPMLAGGPYPTSSHLGIDGVDHVVLGEVEGLCEEIAHDIESGNLKNIYRGKGLPDISHAIVPRFDLLKMDAYGAMSVQYSRGCPFNCEFCDIWTVYGNRPRLKEKEGMIAEIDAIYELGWRGAIFIVDDNFIGNKKRVKTELLPEMISWQKMHHYPFSFFTEASVNMADDDILLNGMKRAGFNQVFLGIETPEKACLEETGKRQNLKSDLGGAVKKIQSKGIEVMAGFILGFDSDTEDIFDRQIAFIQENAIPQAMVGLLAALPGTALYKRLEKEGRILFSSDGNNTHHLSTNFRTRMGEEKLREGYKHVLASLYDKRLKNYFRRCEKMMDRLGDTAHFQRKITVREIVMLLKSLTRQPFTPYGFSYLKFVFRNLFRHPDIFGEVIRYAIIGNHFHMITQEMIKVERVASDLDAAYVYLRERLSKYSGAVICHSKESLQAVFDLWDQRQKILKEINRKINKIHIDFRKDIIETYKETIGNINSLFQNVEDNKVKHDLNPG